MRVLSLFFVFLIVVIAITSSSFTIASRGNIQQQQEQEKQMKIDEFSQKLSEKVKHSEKKIDEAKIIRLPESPRFTGAEDNLDLQYCNTGKDDSADPRNQRLDGNLYERAPLQPFCGRYVIDNFLDDADATALKQLAEFGMALGGGGAGGVTLVDFVGSITSHGKNFANLTALAQRHQNTVKKQRKQGLDNLQDLKDLIPTHGMLVWMKTIHKIHRLVETVFDTNKTCANSGRGRLRLALPAFFSRIDPLEAQTPNDEYWHTHIDTEQYGSFDVTTLLYLSSEREDLSSDDLADTIAGSASGKLAKNRRPETKEERLERIKAKDRDPKNADIFHLGDAPDEQQDEEVRRNADNNFHGGGFEFLDTRKDGVYESEPVSSLEYVSDENDSEICHIGDNAEESIAKIKAQGKSCKNKLVVHPKKGRLTIFTSGPEHPHRVRKVTEGVRWASTNAFTCDAEGKSVDIMNHEEFPAKWLSELAARAVLEDEY